MDRVFMRRRTFVAAIGAAAALPPCARAQQTKRVIGFLSTRAPGEAAAHTAAFLEGLKENGFVDGENLAIEYRWARGRYEQLPAYAAELVAKNVAVLAAGGDPAALAFKAASNTIPIVFLMGDDPVRVGLVESLNRPGGNATGVSMITSAMGAKRLEILLQLAPQARSIALLVNPRNPNAETHTQEVRAAAAQSGRKLTVLAASSEAAVESRFADIPNDGPRALVVQNDPFFDARRDQLVALAARHAIPAIYHIREFPVGGGLASFGPNLVSAYRELGLQTGRVLQGASPRNLPVVRPSTFELVLNAKVAKTLDLPIPDALQARADEIIE